MDIISLNTSLMNYIHTGDIIGAREVLEKGADPNGISAYGDSIVSKFAFSRGNTKPEILELLLIYGADPNATDTIGNSLLMTEENPKIMKLLISYGADINHKNNYNKNALSMKLGQFTDQTEAIDLLLQAGIDVKNDSYVADAVLKNDITLIQKLIQAGADPLRTGQYGYTPLQIALKTIADYHITELLLRYDTNVNQKYGHNITPSMLAGNIDNLKLLIDAGADINQKSDSGKTALIYAIGDPTLFGYLMFRGADPTISEDILIKSLVYFLKPNQRQAFIDIMESYGYKLNKRIYDYYEKESLIRAAYIDPSVKVPRYQYSGRPITDLSFSNKLCQNTGIALPIVRYEMLYNVDSPLSSFCGTFYFYEPNSPYYLTLGNCLIAANKVDAMVRLHADIKQYDYLNIPILQPNISLKFMKKLLDTETDLSYYNTTQGSKINELYMLDNDQYYSMPNGFFDDLDQILCSLARSNGYDTIVFQREPGETRAVTEILDTRSRSKSYDNICYRPKETLFNDYANSSNYPLIWFSEYGFINI